MAWSGGTFTRLDGATHWVDDKNAAINIVASRHDTNDNDFATGINQCLTRDNQAKPTASFLPNADNSIDLGSLAVRWRNLFAVTGQFGDGASGSPSITFGADTNTGLFRNGADDMRFVAGGNVGLFLFATGADVRAEAASAGSPAYSFLADTNTGIFSDTADSLAFAVGGVSSLVLRAGFLSLNAGQYWSPDATAAAPAYSFGNDADTGFYRDTANQIAIALGGAAAGQIAQGSFTGTLTGMTAGTTGTVNYQRIGNTVRIWINSTLAGTSNTTALTMTGLPAIIQPSAAQTGVFNATDNGNSTLAFATVAAGTMTFHKYTGVAAETAASWTNVNGKGLGTGWTVSWEIN